MSFQTYNKDEEAYMLENTYFQTHKQDNAYILQNTYFQNHKREPGDFTPFYVTVTFCTILFAFLIILNIVLGCWSRYSAYWVDRHTGNRWIISLWTTTPHIQPALDYSELENVHIETPNVPLIHPYPTAPSKSLFELVLPHQQPNFDEPPAQLVYSKTPETIELQQKKESAI